MSEQSPADFEPFDPDSCPGPTLHVPSRRILDLLNVSNAPERVVEYAAAMRAGDRFPPVSVIRLGPWFVVADGHKRLSACRSLGVEELVVETWTLRRLAADIGGQAGAYWGEAGRLLLHLPRSADDRRRAWGFAGATVAHWRRMLRSLWRLRS